MGQERRQFRRFEVPADAVAVDAGGATIGRVAQAGGGGMTIFADSAAAAQKLAIGSEHRLTVVEPENKVSTTIDVVVRYCRGAELGVEFITGKA